MTRPLRFPRLLSCRPHLEVLEDRTLLSTCTVDRLTDTGEGSGLTGDLRYCVGQATSGKDTINFSVTGTISVGQEMYLNASVTIEGPGADHVIIRSEVGPSFVFLIGDHVPVSFSGLTISNARIGFINGGDLTIRDTTFAGNRGWGINNLGTLAIEGSTFRDNLAPGILNSSGMIVTVSHSTFTHNVAPALRSDSSIATVVIAYSTFTDNHTDSDLGGAIDNESGTMTVAHSTIANNSALDGGGIFNSGILTIRDSTLTGNRAMASSTAGGIHHQAPFRKATLELLNSTIADNSGSQLFARQSGMGQATIELRNTIIAGGSAPACFTTTTMFTSLGHNLSTDDSCNLKGPGDQLNTDPLLGPLQDSGGPTLTRALSPDSPAVDAGDNTDAPFFDQRGPGFPRIVGIIDPDKPVIDIGAFELQMQGGAATRSRPPVQPLFTSLGMAVTHDVPAHFLFPRNNRSVYPWLRKGWRSQPIQPNLKWGRCRFCRPAECAMRFFCAGSPRRSWRNSWICTSSLLSTASFRVMTPPTPRGVTNSI